MNEPRDGAIPAVLDELRAIKALLAQLVAAQVPANGEASREQLLAIRRLLTELGYPEADQAGVMARAGFPAFDAMTDADARQAIARLGAAKAKLGQRKSARAGIDARS